MEGVFMKKIINGKETEVNVLGGFEIKELGKKYILCSYDDDPTSKKALVMIYEVEENDNEQVLVSIKEDEEELVLKFYNTLKKELLGGTING